MSAQLFGVSIPIMTRATHDPSSILDATEGEDDIVAGRIISHEAMRRWLLSCGSPDELPPPECGE